MALAPNADGRSTSWAAQPDENASCSVSDERPVTGVSRAEPYWRMAAVWWLSSRTGDTFGRRGGERASDDGERARRGSALMGDGAESRLASGGE